jgi:molybdopterin-guanine dinucleotide biosynthesis protein A
MSDSLPILVLAGGGLSPEMREAAGGVASRALIPLNGRPMLDYVLTALTEGRHGAGRFGRLLVAGNALSLPKNAVELPDGTSLVDTLLNGIATLHKDETRLLVSTADIPFLTSEAVSDLIERASHYPEADFLYPIVDAYSCAVAFPGMRRTTLHVAEGEFTGGNLVFINPSFIRTNEAALREAYGNRKNVGELAKMLGFGTMVRLLLSRTMPRVLPISFLEKSVGRLLGGAVACAIVTPYPEIGADIDRPEDIPIAAKILAEQANRPPLPD